MILNAPLLETVMEDVSNFQKEMGIGHRIAKQMEKYFRGLSWILAVFPNNHYPPYIIPNMA